MVFRIIFDTFFRGRLTRSITSQKHLAIGVNQGVNYVITMNGSWRSLALVTIRFCPRIGSFGKSLGLSRSRKGVIECRLCKECFHLFDVLGNAFQRNFPKACIMKCGQFFKCDRFLFDGYVKYD